MKERLRLWKNWVRIKLLSVGWIGRIFHRRVKQIEIKAPDGKVHKATIEAHEEKVCTHSKLEEIGPMVWKCLDCDDAYFFITQKLIATRAEAIHFVEKMSAHFNLHGEQTNKR